MTSTLIHMAGREHAHDLLREAERISSTQQVRTARARYFELPRFLVRRRAHATT